jgi:hypothetical protein
MRGMMYMKRDSFGRIILDDYEELNHNIIGRKEKVWLKKDDNKYLFKCGASNYEIYAELIAEQLALQCGFETASYDIATYQGKTGVVTPSFLKFGDIIISGDKYLANARDIAMQNNIKLDLTYNTIENIILYVLASILLKINKNFAIKLFTPIKHYFYIVPDQISAEKNIIKTILINRINEQNNSNIKTENNDEKKEQ